MSFYNRFYNKISFPEAKLDIIIECLIKKDRLICLEGKKRKSKGKGKFALLSIIILQAMY